MKFHYEHTSDFGEPLRKRLGLYPRTPDLTWDFFRWWGSWFSALFIRSQFCLEVVGEIPEDDRLAIVANHQSHLDTATLLSALPYGKRRKTVVLAAEDYFFKTPLKAMVASLFCQGVAFDRKHWTAIRSWYKHFKNLKNGWLLFYPSGSRHSKEIQPALLKILLREGWTILPVHLKGAEKAWPAHDIFWHPFCKLQVTFCEPYRGQDIDELLTLLKRELYPS
jgi:1-acyl-sn-glycerol-3-phosphate acyltransferase